MQRKSLILQATVNSLTTFLYTALVGWILFNAQTLFGDKTPNFLGIAAFLLLFVLSAAIVGLLILGRPALMYFNGERQEPVKLLLYTIFSLAIITAVVMIIYAFIE